MNAVREAKRRAEKSAGVTKAVPKPAGGESQSDYIARCAQWAASEHPEMHQDQRLAMCYSTYRDAKGKSVTKAEILAELSVEHRRLRKALEDAGVPIGKDEKA